MVGMSSVLPPARRVSGVRPVQSVRGPARQKSRPQQPETTIRGPEPERTGWRDRDQIDGEPFIDAEFVEVLREAASAVTIIGPIDGTLRQALEAYRRAGKLRSILGSVIDIPT
jgi:hypothetical protein